MSEVGSFSSPDHSGFGSDYVSLIKKFEAHLACLLLEGIRLVKSTNLDGKIYVQFKRIICGGQGKSAFKNLITVYGYDL